MTQSMPAATEVDEAAPGVRYSWAYQPIVDVVDRSVVSYEALIRGPLGESAASVFRDVEPAESHRFDQESRISAVAFAARLGLACDLNLNVLPQSVLASPAAILSTVEAAERCGISASRLVIELTEGEFIEDPSAFGERLGEVRRHGVRLVIDDFGAGYAGLTMLADFLPDMLKLDMKLVRGIEAHGSRQAIARGIVQVCGDLGIDVVAEGVETRAEYHWLEAAGVRLFQGYLFGRPGFETLPEPNF